MTSVQNAQTIENFYGVYLLYCQNPKFKGRTYIGYTVDPNRRIKQHNKGMQFGGAWKTNNKGPWSMVMIVYGFPNDISALRFEWAWQHPHISRRLKHVQKKKAKEKTFDFCLRVLSEMLQVPPWCRLPLNVRWLNQEFIRDFPVHKQPPFHMSISFGSVISRKTEKKPLEQIENCEDVQKSHCSVCQNVIERTPLECLNYLCNFLGHIKCLSKHFLQPGEYVPVEGTCPSCNEHYLWGDLIKKYKGCYSSDLVIDTDLTSNLYFSDCE